MFCHDQSMLSNIGILVRHHGSYKFEVFRRKSMLIYDDVASNIGKDASFPNGAIFTARTRLPKVFLAIARETTLLCLSVDHWSISPAGLIALMANNLDKRTHSFCTTLGKCTVAFRTKRVPKNMVAVAKILCTCRVADTTRNHLARFASAALLATASKVGPLCARLLNPALDTTVWTWNKYVRQEPSLVDGTMFTQPYLLRVFAPKPDQTRQCLFTHHSLSIR